MSTKLTPDGNFGLSAQRAIYLNGAAGKKPRIPTDTAQLERAAAQCLPVANFAYIAGGAGSELTMDANTAAFRKWKIVPRVFRKVDARDTSVELFGRKLPAPFLLAPVGVLSLAHPEGDLAVGKAAAAQGIPMIFSNQASFPMEKVAAVMGDSPRWFQLYWSKSDELVKSLVQRAEACGCEAIVVTLDTTMLGWRPRDLNLGYLPFMRGLGIAQYTSDPVFQEILRTWTPPPGPKPTVNLSSLGVLWQMLRNYPGGFRAGIQDGVARKAVQLFTAIYSNPAITWEKIDLLRTYTRLPIVLKGILHPADAALAIQKGVDGIIVSNHGGRQVDGSMGALDALPGVVAAVAGKIPVLFDSGIRTGADALKALSLGARAVCIGRPYAYALAIDGQRGVAEWLSHFRAEFDLTMGLAGCARIAEIQPDLIARTQEH